MAEFQKNQSAYSGFSKNENDGHEPESDKRVFLLEFGKVFTKIGENLAENPAESITGTSNDW